MYSLKKSITLFVFVIILVVPLAAQTTDLANTTDSIHHVAATLSSDTARINFYYKHISNSLDAKQAGADVDLNQLETYAKIALKLAEQTDYILGEVNINQMLGSIYWSKESYQQAGEYYRKALELSENLNNIEKIAQLTFNIGLCEYRSGMYGEALEYYLIALSYQKELGNNATMFKCYNAINNAYFYVGDYASNKQSSLEALELASRTNDTLNEALFSISVADACKRMQDSTLAIKYYDRALSLYKQSGKALETAMALNNKATAYAPTSPQKLASFLDAVKILEEITPPTSSSITYLSHIYVNIGLWYAKVDNHDTAKAYFEKAMATVQKANNKFQMVFQYSTIANYYFEQGNYLKAKQLAEYTIALINTHIGTNHSFDIALKILSKIYAKEGSYQKAYETLQQWSIVNDSIKSKAQQEQLAKINRQFEFERHKQLKLNTQQLDIERQKLAIQAQRDVIIGLIGGCISLFVIGLLIYIYSRQLRTKNYSLFRQIKGQDRLANELSQLTDRYEALLQAVPQACQEEISYEPAVSLFGDKQQQSLVARLREYLLRDANLTKTNISREELISALGTNKNNLSEAVKAATGKTLMEYIRNLKLEESRRMLDNHPELTVEAIAFGCGFNAVNTFYRLFRKHYGISPAEYRKLSNTIER